MVAENPLWGLPTGTPRSGLGEGDDDELFGENLMKLDYSDILVVLLTTYKRLDHVKQTIEALKANTLANETVLYISSDGPGAGDEEAVCVVRDYLKTVDGFKSVELRFRDVNDRKGNWRLRRELLVKYGSLVFLEEDCIASTHFLQYMKDALIRYESDSKIFAICGYRPPFSPINSTISGSLLIPRFNAWGFAFWRDRDAHVESHLELDAYRRFYEDRSMVKFARDEVGLDIIPKLRHVAKRGVWAYDILANFQLMSRRMTCVYPAVSLVRNIGHDGTGEHCGQTGRFEVKLADSLPCVDLDPNSPKRFLKQHAIFRSGGWYAYLRLRFRLFRGKFSLKS